MSDYVIIPNCSDLNRGDQALVWETVQIAKAAGFLGKYYFISANNEPSEQTQAEGINVIGPILEHPSRLFSKKENIDYSIQLKICWGMVAVFDFMWSYFYFNDFTRKLIWPFLSKNKKNTLHVFMDADAFFVKGGGLLHTYGGVTAPYYMYHSLFHIRLALSLKKDVYILPNSFGPFKGIGVKHMVKSIIKKCRIVSARETLSQKAVKENLGIDIPVYADLAFNLKKSAINIEQLKKEYDLSCGKKLVAITMRPYRFPGSDDPKAAYQSFKYEMTEFIKWLVKKDYMPIIIQHTLAINSHESDISCINDVVSGLVKDTYRIIQNDSFNCRDLKAIYSKCDYIVGTRFHSVIFSVSEGVPGIAITYGGNKGQGIMKDMGLSELAIEIENLSAPILEKKFEYLVQNEYEVKEKIKIYLNYAQKNREKLVCELNEKHGNNHEK